MATRNEPEVNPAIRRLLGSARARNERIGQHIDALQGREPVQMRNEFEDKIDTAVRMLAAAEQRIVEAAREKMPSAPGNVTIHVEQARRDRESSDPPSTRVDISLPLFGRVRARGMRAVLVVAAVALLLALAWMASGRRLPMLPAEHAPAETHT